MASEVTRIRLAAVMALLQTGVCKCGKKSTSIDNSFNEVCDSCLKNYGCEYWKLGFNNVCDRECQNECFRESIQHLSDTINKIKEQEPSKSVKLISEEISETIKRKGLLDDRNYKL